MINLILFEMRKDLKKMREVPLIIPVRKLIQDSRPDFVCYTWEEIKFNGGNYDEF